MISKNRFSAWLLLVLSFSANLALAHPHLRLAYQLQPLLSEGAIRGFHISWQMDAQNSLQVRENIDLNNNGSLDPDELQAFAEGNQSLMLPYQFFLTIEDGQNAGSLPFEVKNFSARDGGRGFQGGIYLEFDVQLTQTIAKNHVQLQMQDPTWYIGFMPRLGQILVSDSECDSDFTREKRQTPTQGEQEVQRIVVHCSTGTAARPDQQISPNHGPVQGDNS